MKQERISTSQLKQQLAQAQNISEREAGLFIEAMINSVSEGLVQDGQVRITGLGQFKVQAVQPRKSVDVNTGNEIIIEGYNKVSFTPEATIKSQIKETAPAAVPHKEEFDPIQKLGQQADAIMDIIADINKPTEPEIPENPVTPITPITPDTPVTPTTTETPASPTAQPFIPPKIETTENKQEHNSRPFIITGIVIASLLLLCIVGYFVFQPQVDTWIAGLMEKTENVPDTVLIASNNNSQQEVYNEETDYVEPEGNLSEDTETKETEEIVQEPAIPQETAKTEQPAIQQETAQTEQPVQKIQSLEIKHFIEIHEDENAEPIYDVVKSGVTLAALARKHYNGQTDFWVYIYDANRDQLSAPSSVKLGMKLRIPNIDDRDPDVILEAQRRVEEYRRNRNKNK